MGIPSIFPLLVVGESKTVDFGILEGIKLRCDSRFQRAFTACSCVFNAITLLRDNQRNFFENATACSERTLNMTVAT